MNHYNAAQWLIDRHVDEGNGERIAIRCDGVSTTYIELRNEMWRAQALLVDLDLSTGDRIALVLQDDADFPALFLGAMRSGVVPIPLSTMLKGPALAAIVADSGASVIAISDTFASALPEILAGAPTVTSVIATGDPRLARAGAGAVAVHEWRSDDEGGPQPIAATTTDSPALWLYSSGTTGTPKGVMHRHASLQATADTYAAQVLQTTEDDRFLSIAKLFFAYGLGNSLTFPFAVGGTAILHPGPPTPGGMAQLIADEKPTLFFASPGFCAAMLDAKPDPQVFQTLRATVTAGESLPANVQTRFAELTGQPVLDGIGSTELLHIFISNNLDRQTPGASGWVVPGYEAELRDDSGAPVDAVDTPGYLHVKGPSSAVGYWDRPDATTAAFANGWVRTGDVYTQAADESWTFLGRNNDMIKAGGIWVSPAEVESVLIEHPDVMEAAVVGARDEQGLETVVAFVLPSTGTSPSASDLDAHCRDRMASFKRPRQIVIVDDLPKTATGKIKRFELRDSLG